MASENHEGKGYDAKDKTGAEDIASEVFLKALASFI